MLTLLALGHHQATAGSVNAATVSESLLCAVQYFEGLVSLVSPIPSRIPEHCGL